MEPIEVRIVVHNASQKRLVLYLEPWGEEYPLDPEVKYLVMGHGPQSGSGFVVEYGEHGIVVTAWTGATVRLFRDGTEIGKVSHRPPVPDFL